MTNSFNYSYESSQPFERWGHYASQILMFAIAAVVAFGTQPIRQTPSGATLSVSLSAFVIATWLAMRQHDRRLCERCIASIPLNAEEAAAKAHMRFRVVHLGARPEFVVPYLAVLIATNFIPGQGGRLIWALAQSTMIYLIMSSDSHRKLQPWCHICRGEGDGGGEDRVTPEPKLPRDLARS